MSVEDVIRDLMNERERAWGIASHFADELIGHWHKSGDDEERELHEYMGLSFAAYSRFVGLGIRSLSVPVWPTEGSQ